MTDIRPMRLPGAEPTWAEFRHVLKLATEGVQISDTGLPQPVEDALDTVRAAAPNASQELLDAATETFRRCRRRTG